MAKITFSDIASGFQSVGTINNNYTQLEYELQNKVLYRNNPSGEPNAMQHDLDMNGYNILNLGQATVISSLSATQSVLWGTQRNGTGTHSLSTGDVFRTIEVSASSSVTAVMYLTKSVTGGWIGGEKISLIQLGSGVIKIQPETSVTVRCAASYLGTRRKFGQIVLAYRGSDIWYLDGDISV